MRDERETKLSDVASLLERATRLATSDPAAALAMVQETLRACRRAGGVQCLENRAFALLGWILARLGRFGHSEKAFRVSYSSGCPCCQPAIDRQVSWLLSKQGRHAEAVERAERAAQGAKTQAQKGLAFLTLGSVRLYAGDVAGSIRDGADALRLISVKSPHHDVARANLTLFLSYSERPEDVAQAFDMISDLERRFKGIKRKSQERAKLSWMTGGILARHAIFFKLTGWKLKGQLSAARGHIEKAVNGLDRLGMRLDAAAARTDLAAVKVMIDPLTAGAALSAIDVGLDLPKAAAVEAAQAILSPERLRQLWVALRTLRNATVSAGCSPPLVPYSSGA